MTVTQLSVVMTWKTVMYEMAMLSKWWRCGSGEWVTGVASRWPEFRASGWPEWRVGYEWVAGR